MPHIYIITTVLLSIYTQLIIKWQLEKTPQLSESLPEKFFILLTLLANPWIFSTLLATFIGGLSWMAALTQFPVSYAFPFVSLAFVGVLVFGSLFFNEPINFAKILGMTLIVTGLIISSSELQ